MAMQISLTKDINFINQRVISISNSNLDKNGKSTQRKKFTMKNYRPINSRQIEHKIDKHIDRITDLQRQIDAEEQALFQCQKQSSQCSKEQGEETLDKHLNKITEFQILLAEEEKALFIYQKQRRQFFSAH